MSSTQAAEISSARNPRFKQWRRWANHPEERECPWVPVTGVKQVQDLADRQPIQLLLLGSEPSPEIASLQPLARDVVRLKSALLSRLAGVEDDQGLLAFFSKPVYSWEDLHPRLLYLDRLQDPGNLGTIIRTAAAFGGVSIITSPGCVALFNEKVVRASAGYLFRVPMLEKIPLEEVFERGYPPWYLEADAGRPMKQVNFGERFVCVFGNEGSGILAAGGERDPHRTVHIEMVEEVESLNVAVTAALVMYEIRRKELDG